MKNLLLIILVLAAIVLAAWLVSRHNAPPAAAEVSQQTTAAAPAATNTFALVAPPSAAATAPSAATEPTRTPANPAVLGGLIAGGATESLEAELQKVVRISPEDLDARMKTGAVVVIDVRDADAYTFRHITGAMHIPLSRIIGEVPYIPRDKPIVTYCT